MADVSLLKKKLAGYSALAGVIIAFSKETDAQIIYTDVNPDDIIHDQTILLDLNNDGINDFRIKEQDSDCSGYDLYERPLGNNEVIEANSGSNYGAAALDLGDTISSALQNNLYWGSTINRMFTLHCTNLGSGPCSYCSSGGFWQGTNHYLGLKVELSDGYHYGWARLSMYPDIVLKDFAYQSQPGISIMAGEFENADTLQAIVTPSDTISVCGNYTLHFTVNAGPSYLIQWQYNGVNISGATYSTYSTSQSGNYRAIVSTVAFADTSNTVTFIIHQIPANPFLSRTADTLYSNYATGNVWTFNYDTISVAQSCLISQNGFYGLQYIDSAGCHTSIVYQNETICDDLVHAVFNVYPPVDSICESDSIQLLSNYCCWTTSQWLINGSPITGADSTSYYTDSTGIYSLVVSNTIQCFDTSGVWQLTMLQNPDPVLSQFSDSLVSNYPTGNQWYANGTPIPGATNQTFIPAQSGSYQVEVTDSNGCTAISQPFDFINTNISNPVELNFFDAFVDNHHLHIRFNQSPLPSRMILFNSLGVKLSEYAITESEMVMDVSRLVPGIYFVTVDDDKKRRVRKVAIE